MAAIPKLSAITSTETDVVLGYWTVYVLDVLSSTSLVCVQVEAYLEAFASAFKLSQFIQYRTKVLEVMPVDESRLQDGTKSQTNGFSDGHNGASAHPEAGDDLPWPRWQVTTTPADAEVWRASASSLESGSFSRVL